MTILRIIAAMTLAAVPLAAIAAEKPTIDSAKQKFAKIVEEQLARNITPGFSVAWIVDGKTVHAAGYGKADMEKGAADADTIYRAGSISKLFNAVGAMQLVEQGKLDLDAPIQKALPEFSIVNPFRDPGTLTVRQMLSHRSGMIREAPVGGYLDPNQPTVKATVASVADCVLVNNPPNPKARYSNVAPTIVGRAVEVQSGMSFSDYQDKYVLEPLGMTSSAWLMNDKLRPRLAKATMRVAHADGTFHDQTAPEFELGTIPAGNLYTSANDLAKFAAFLMSGDGGKELSPPILKPESLKEMSKPQLTKEANDFGLGFMSGEYRKHRTLQHGGAVYGFSTVIVVMPEENIGVVVLSNSDISSGPVRRLTDASLDLLLEAVKGESMPEEPKPIEVSAADLAKFTGEYESQSYWCKVEVKDGKLKANISTQPIDLTPVGEMKFLGDGRIMNRGAFDFTKDDDGKITGFSAVNQKFTRVDPAKVVPAPEHWKQFCGAYGSDFIPLVISIRNGHLYAMAENEYDYRLEPINRVTFRSPPGMYDEECIVFQTTPDGKPIGAIMFNMYLPRRDK